MNRYVNKSVQVCEYEWRTEVKSDSGEQTKYVVRTVYSKCMVWTVYGYVQLRVTYLTFIFLKTAPYKVRKEIFSGFFLCAGFFLCVIF